MKESIIFAPSETRIMAKAFSEIFSYPIILTTIDQDSIDGYHELRDIFSLDLHQIPNIEEKWKINVNPLKGGDWRLIQCKDLDAFVGMLDIINRSDEYMIIFSSDVKSNSLKRWILKNEEKHLNTNKVFLPDVEFEENPELITSFSKGIILHGFLSFYDNYDYLIVSKDTSALEQIMQSAEQSGEPRLPDYTDSLSFKKSYDDSAIFFTDLGLVIKNRLKYKNYSM